MDSKYKFGFLHYLRLLKESFIIGYKSLLEYKINMISGLIHHILYLPTFIFAYLFIQEFGQIIGWNFGDYIMLSFFAVFPVVIMGTIYWGKELRHIIPKGDLNSYLFRPGNKFFNYLSVELNENMPQFLIYNILTHVPLMIIFIEKIYLIRIFLGILIRIYLGCLFILITLFYDSFNFYFIGISKSIDDLMYEGRELLEVYPAQFFTYSKIKYLLVFMPTYFVATLIVPLVQKKEIINLEFQIIFLILITIISIIGIKINWHYGLKKYEAFG